MTLAIDEHLHVSSVDSFLILRCPDAVRVCMPLELNRLRVRLVLMRVLQLMD